MTGAPAPSRGARRARQERAARAGLLRIARRLPVRVRRVLRRPVAAGQRLLGTWRRSLRFRVVVITVGVGTLALVALGAYLTLEIRAGTFSQRVEQVLSDAAERTATGQESIDSATATTGAEVQQLANDLVTSLQGSGSGAVGTLLLRSPSDLGLVLIIDPVTDRGLIGTITPELRAAVQREGGQQWQSVAVPDGETSAPGVVVGSPITLKSAGAYELYFVYSLARENATLLFVQRTLGIGTVVLVLLQAAMAWFLTRRVLEPVRQAALTAERLSDGRLDERMQLRGDDELTTLAASFNEMAASLQDQIQRMEKLSRMQQRFVSDVSHELRTPLTTIRMAGDLIHGAREDFPPAVRRSAELLVDQLDRFDRLLADLLEISRFDAGAAALDVEESDIRVIVDRVVEAHAPLAERAGTRVAVRSPERSCSADVDPRRIERIVRNLLVNAIEHAEGGPVDVDIGVDARAVAVAVRDHGVGMTAQDAEHAFDRFWRADPARARTTGGTGLGLAISREDALLHGGSLEAWGRPGEGASFRLTVPRRSGVVVERSPLPLAPEGAGSAAPEGAAGADASGPDSRSTT